MDSKSVVLLMFCTIYCSYAVLLGQIGQAIICILLVAGLIFMIEIVIPVLVAFFHNIQRIADNLEAMKNQLKSDPPSRIR
jgi:hypothetical protein